MDDVLVNEDKRTPMVEPVPSWPPARPKDFRYRAHDLGQKVWLAKKRKAVRGYMGGQHFPPVRSFVMVELIDFRSNGRAVVAVRERKKALPPDTRPADIFGRPVDAKPVPTLVVTTLEDVSMSDIGRLATKAEVERWNARRRLT